MSHTDANALRDILRILERLIERKEVTMSQVQLSVTFNVAPAVPPPSPLVLTPPSATLNLTVGTAADGTVVSAVSGGVPPYSYALDATSGPLPTGITFAEDGAGNISLAGTPSVAGSSSSPVILDVTDSAGATASLTAAVRTIR